MPAPLPLAPSLARPLPPLPLPPQLELARLRDKQSKPDIGQRFSRWRHEADWLESKTSQTRPWYAGPHYYRPETQVFDRRDYPQLIAPAPPAERWVTGVPLFDTFFKGQWLLPSPLGWAGMRPLELILLILWLVKSNVISALTFPFLMLFLPIFNDGHGALSIITGRGALPEFKHLLGKENYAAAKAPPSPPWTESVVDP